MINIKFEAYKIKRELKRIGKEYEFKRAKLNEFKEPTEEKEPVGKLTGIYHEQNNHISVVTGDTTQTRTKKTPMILCLYDDSRFVKKDDIITINDKIFKVTGIVNIQEWNIVSDISLEVLDNVI